MTGRMPILRQHHMVETLKKPIDYRHHSVTVADSQRAARAEIILHVDYKQQIVVGSDQHRSASAGTAHPA
jgi:hypothetical protein